MSFSLAVKAMTIFSGEEDSYIFLLKTSLHIASEGRCSPWGISSFERPFCTTTPMKKEEAMEEGLF